MICMVLPYLQSAKFCLQQLSCFRNVFLIMSIELMAICRDRKNNRKKQILIPKSLHRLEKGFKRITRKPKMVWPTSKFFSLISFLALFRTNKRY